MAYKNINDFTQRKRIIVVFIQLVLYTEMLSLANMDLKTKT